MYHYLTFLCTPAPKTMFKQINKLEAGTWLSFDEKGNINEESNPNGSLENIAGIYNQKKNILGMMPHPERMVDNLISNSNGVELFTSILS